MTRVRDALSAKGFVWAWPFSTVTVPTATRTGTRTGAVVTVEPGGLVARLTRRCPAEIVKPRTQVSLLGLGHVDELDRRGGAPSGGNRFRDLVGKVPRCWVPGGRHGKDNVGTVPVDLNRAKQPELADAVKQARIDYSTDGRLEGLDGMGHQPGGVRSFTSFVDPGLLLNIAAATGTLTV